MKSCSMMESLVVLLFLSVLVSSTSCVGCSVIVNRTLYRIVEVYSKG